MMAWYIFSFSFSLSVIFFVRFDGTTAPGLVKPYAEYVPNEALPGFMLAQPLKTLPL